MFIECIYNIALLVACCVVSSLVPHQKAASMSAKRSGAYYLVPGLFVGCLGILVMSQAFQFAPGVIFDSRSIILCVAGVVFGPVIAAIAAVLCVFYRLWLGGAGALMGVCVIVESALLGSVYYHLRQQDSRLEGYLPLYALGLLVHVIMLVFMLGLPDGSAADVLRRMSLPVLCLYPFGVMLLSSFFLDQTARIRNDRALAQSEKNYRELIEIGNILIVRWNLDGTISYANNAAAELFGSSASELPGTMHGEHFLEVGSEQPMARAILDDPEALISHEKDYVLKDGTQKWVYWTGKALRDSSGAITEILFIGFDCTARKRMEGQFFEGQMQNLRIVETASEGIWSLDKTLCTTFMNLKNCELLGYDPDDIHGRGMEDFLFQEDVARHSEMMAACMQGESNLFEQRFARRDGSELLSLVSATPVMDEQGRFDGLFYMLTDISKQKQAQFALQQSEKKYRALFKSMTQGVFYQRADGTLTDINPAGLKLFGLNRDQFLGRTSNAPEWDVIGEDGSLLSPGEHPSMRALKSGSPVRDVLVGVFNARLRDYVWLIVNAIPIFNEGESLPCEVIVTLHDISVSRKVQAELVAREQQIRTLLDETQKARKTLLSILEDDLEINASLQQSEERYRSVVETASDAIITLDSVGKIVLWNRAATHIFGYTTREIVGAPFSMLISNDVSDQEVRSLLEALKSGVLPAPLMVNEVIALKQNGQKFPIEIAFGIVTQDQNRHITAIIRDISVRKLIEQEALRSAQLVSIGELAAGVAHEINNPIMGVINYAQILLNDNRTQGGDIEIPARIIKEGERIASIVSNLLNLARPVSGAHVVISVREIFEPALQLMHKLLQQSDVVLDAKFCDTQERVLVFPAKIQQVFINLISNALYALDMRFSGPHPDKRLDVWVEESFETGLKFTRVVFLDHGCGIASEDLARICNPFYSTKPQGKGTGLGLSICHKILQEHGGRLLFESTVGEYTKVMVDLPGAP